MRKLTKALAAMSLLAPMVAYPLGIGEIKLHSALNQKLNAEIALSLSAGEELADIKVTLASPDKFDEAGIAWSYFLSKVKFQPVLQANGKVVVKMTSHEVVQEPYLDFLLEVSWPKGDVLKEFTVLVDPPQVYQQQISTPSTQAVITPAKMDSSASTDAANDFSHLAVEGEYGPTTRNDSLWKVAEKINQDNSISVEQMMMALYKANPRAFYKKNVNALMAGKTLKIPTKSEIVVRSKKQANTEFYRQMAVWEGKAVAEPEVQLAENKQSNTNQLTLAAPVEEELNQSQALAANGENVQGLAVENTQLQERLANLEKQFLLMQEMLAIKDQQLAALQNVPQEQIESNIVVPEEVVNEPDSEATLGETALSTENSTLESTQTSNDQLNSSVTTSENATTTAIQPAEQVTPQAVAPVEQSSGINYYYLGFGILGLLALSALGLVLWRKRQTEEETNDNSMFASSSEIILPKDDDDDQLSVPVFDETPSYDVGTVGESSFLSEFTPSDFDVFETDQAEVDPTSETDVYLAYGRYQQAEELMRHAISESPDRDDFKLKLLEIFYASENEDGFVEFAQELNKQGKSSDYDFWAKVSEMGGEISPDSALFSEETRESKFDVPDLGPSNEEPVVDEVGAIEEFDEQVVVSKPIENADNSDIDFDLSSFSLMESDDDEEPKAKSTAPAGDIESLDFDLSSFEGIAEEKAPVVPTDDIESIDFDVSSIQSVKEEKPTTLDAETDELETFDFDVDNSVEQHAPIEISMDDMDDPVGTLELDAEESSTSSLADFDFSDTLEEKIESSAAAVEVSSAASDTAKIENNDFDFDFDFDDAPAASESEISISEDDLMVSDLTDMDEFETKIDLAKAYIDMGDEASAKDIAQEVLEKGSDTQKVEAQAVLDKLS